MNKSSKSVKGARRPSTYKSRGGVYKTPSGTFCAQKQVDGRRVSATFRFKRDAIAYIMSLEGRI